MPATGRSYYPNVPGSLEEALAGSVAAGTSPWAPVLMMNARNERRQAIDAVNETQANQFMLGLQSALQQERIKAGATILGDQVRGGHAIGPAMTAANQGGYTAYDPNDIAAETLLGRAGEAANVGKTINEGQNQGVQAGTYNDLTGLGAALELPTVLGTPRDITKTGMEDTTKLAVADKAAAAKRYATDNKKVTPKAPAPDKVTIDLAGGGTLVHEVRPGELATDDQDKLAKHLQQAAVDVTHSETGTAAYPSGDTPQVDPELAAQQAHLANNGYTLDNGHGAPRVGAKDGKIGKYFKVKDPQGRPTEVFIANVRQ